MVHQSHTHLRIINGNFIVVHQSHTHIRIIKDNVIVVHQSFIVQCNKVQVTSTHVHLSMEINNTLVFTTCVGAPGI